VLAQIWTFTDEPMLYVPDAGVRYNVADPAAKMRVMR